MMKLCWAGLLWAWAPPIILTMSWAAFAMFWGTSVKSNGWVPLSTVMLYCAVLAMMLGTSFNSTGVVGLFLLWCWAPPSIVWLFCFGVERRLQI